VEVVYEDAVRVEARRLTVTGEPPSIAVSAPTPIGIGTHPRIAGNDVVLDASTQLRVVDLATNTDRPLAGLPRPLPDAWSVATVNTTAYVFAIYDSSLWVIVCP
jgi:hypothetical protein